MNPGAVIYLGGITTRGGAQKLQKWLKLVLTNRLFWVPALQPRDLVESWQCPLWKTGTWCKPWEKVPMESEFESVLPTFTLALVFCLLWVHIHCSGIVYLNTVAPKRTDLCMQISKLWETEATQSFVRVNCFFFFFGEAGVGGTKQSKTKHFFPKI